ncbi:MAG: HD domain-containing protein [Sphingorhabdus sp.]
MSAFISLETATPEDWARLESPENAKAERRYIAESLLNLLRYTKNSPLLGWPVNIYEHCLQTATRAYRGGADEETIICALFHDATEVLDGHNHAEIASLLLKPYVSENHYWMVKHHAIFQDIHCLTNKARYSEEREAYRGHPAFEQTVHFCAAFDQNSFDPDYDTMPLEAFEPTVWRVIGGA